MATVLFAESEARRSLGKHSAIVHAAVSPPRELWGLADERTGRGFERLRSRAYAAAKRAGIEGGGWVFHRTRRDCRGDREDPGEVDGPHFHVLGFGWVEQPPERRRRGWVVKNLGVRRGRASVLGTARYVLDHSHRREATASGGILPEGKSGGETLTVTWTGRLVPAAKIAPEGPYCPLCERCYHKSEWLELEWAGQGPPPTEPCAMRPGEWRAVAFDRSGSFGAARRVSVYRGSTV